MRKKKYKKRKKTMIKFILIMLIAVVIIGLSFVVLRKIQTYFDKTYRHK